MNLPYFNHSAKQNTLMLALSGGLLRKAYPGTYCCNQHPLTHFKIKTTKNLISEDYHPSKIGFQESAIFNGCLNTRHFLKN